MLTPGGRGRPRNPARIPPKALTEPAKVLGLIPYVTGDRKRTPGGLQCGYRSMNDVRLVVEIANGRLQVVGCLF
jgi:hypothetical protein